MEIESQRTMMEALRSPLRGLLPSGNTESNNIYECQTAPMMTDSIVDVALLGEVVRRCIPNYVVGGYDIASASAHCHVVGFQTELEENQIEALMVGLMPFLSLSWLRPKFAKYVFRASVSGTGNCSRYARFTVRAIDSDVDSRYGTRYGWVRNQSDRHRSPAIEVRSNENSPLWLYFINPILTNQGLVDVLRAMVLTPEYRELATMIRSNDASLDILHEFIGEVKAIMIPFLLNSLDAICGVITEPQREFGRAILTAYLTEDYEAYSMLINGLIDSDAGVTETFKIINGEYEKNKDKFNVIEEVE